MTEREDVFVARTHSGRDDAFELGEHLLLDRHLLEHRLEDEVATDEGLPFGATRYERAEKARLAFGQTTTPDELAELLCDPGDCLVDLLPGQVAHDDRRLEAAEEEQRQLTRHEPGADDADLPNPVRLRLRDSDAALCATLDEVECVHGRLCLWAGKELGKCVLLCPVAVFERPGRRPLDEVDSPVRRRSRAMNLAVEAGARLSADLGDVGQIGGRTSLAGAFLDLVEQEGERLVEELHRLEEHVGEPGLERLACVEHPVLAERVLDDEPDCLLGPHELRYQLCPAPAGNEPEKHLGAREMANGRCEGPVVAVKRDLDPASDRCSVDRSDGRKRQVADSPEELVPRRAAESRSLRCDLAELPDVCADREDERLAGEEHPAPVACPELVEDAFERAERRLAERIRLPPVLAVVHRHERDRADVRVDPLELELRRPGPSHPGRSPRGSPRPCRARCRVRSGRSASQAGRGTHVRAAP